MRTTEKSKTSFDSPWLSRYRLSGIDVHLRDLRYFVAVAEMLHFGRAAERLFISQPALSRQIAKLERDLGTTLLERDRRTVELTASGAELLSRSRDLLASWDGTLVAVAQADAAAASVLRLGIQTSVGRGIVPDLQQALKTRNPVARLELQAVAWDDPSVGLAGGEVDVAIAWLPLPTAGYRVAVVASEPRHVAMIASHRLAERDRLTLAEIEDEALIALPESAGPLRDFWLAEDERSSPAKIATVARNAEEALEAVSSGVGMILLSAGNAELYARKQIATALITDIGPAELALIADENDGRPVIRHMFESVARRAT